MKTLVLYYHGGNKLDMMIYALMLIAFIIIDIFYIELRIKVKY